MSYELEVDAGTRGGPRPPMAASDGSGSPSPAASTPLPKLKALKTHPRLSYLKVGGAARAGGARAPRSPRARGNHRREMREARHQGPSLPLGRWRRPPRAAGGG